MDKWCSYYNCWCSDVQDIIDEDYLISEGCLDYLDNLNCDLCGEAE